MGFGPFALALFFAFLDLYEGGSSIDRIWDNEMYAWGLIFLIFQVLAIVVALTLFKTRRIFASGAILAALFGISLYAYSYSPNQLKPKSYADVDQLQLFRFWVDGGGWLLGVVVVPLAVWYIALLVKEQRRSGPTTEAVHA